MSIPIVIPWLPSTGNTAAIASVQTIGAAGGNLVLNSNAPNLPQGPYIYDRVIRKVLITGPEVEFTITGIGSPVDASGNPTQVLGPVTEQVTGSLVGTESINIYSQVISISLDGLGPAEDVSAGFGGSGITDYVFLDYNRKSFQASAQLQFINQDGDHPLTVTVYQTLSKPQTPNISFGNLDNFSPLPAFAVSAPLTGATTNQLGILQSPVSLVWANMNNTAADSLFFTVLQQGIR